MAVAGLVVQCMDGNVKETMEALAAVAGVVDVQSVPGQAGAVDAQGVARLPSFALVFECPSDSINKEMQRIKSLPFVLLLDLAYVNYEEELESEGNIPCPPLERRSSKRRHEPILAPSASTGRDE